VRIDHDGSCGRLLRANLFACVAAGLASMWGPMHGGANEASMQMLGDIESVEQVPAFISKVKRDPLAFRRLGFGNSRYKYLDPRAAILRETCHKVLAELGMSDRLLQVAMALEEVALNDPTLLRMDFRRASISIPP
jgi:citrate synthase